jgi:thiol-disulfide isomerase/thioredoxin
MKHTISILIGLIFTITLNAQNHESGFVSKLIYGCPKDIEPIKNQFRLKNFSYTNLETGIDSIKIVFGTMIQGDNGGYWISSYFNENLKTFEMVSLEKEKSSDFFTKSIDIKLDNSTRKISLHVKHNPSTNEIICEWLDGNKKSKKLIIQSIDKPLQKNKLLPDFKIVSLTGKNISSSEFQGKFLVINWWATTCAPCRKEIPGLNKLVDKFDTNSNIEFLAIAFDEKSRLENFLKSQKFKYSQTLGDRNISKIFGESFPKNIIVNPEGLIVYYSEGGHENKYMEIEKELLKQLNAK